MTDDQRVLYDNAGEVRNTDILVRWSIAGIFLILHSTGGTFVLSRLTTESALTTSAFCLTGAFLGFVWLCLNVRMQAWIRYWNSRLEALERETEPQAILVFGGVEYTRIVNDPLSTFHVLIVLNVVVTMGWFTMFTSIPFLR